MKRPRFRPGRRWRAALAVLVLLPAAWTALVMVVPTGCARQKIADRLSLLTGRKVTLGDLRVGAFGGLRLSDLAVGAPGTTDDPWLRVGGATIDVSLVQLLFGQITPTAVDARDVRLRVLRRADGRLELADLLRPAGDTPAGDGRTPDVAGAGLEVRVSGATVTVVDEPTSTRLELTGVEGRGTFQGCRARVTELRGALNGGTFQLAVQLDRSEAASRFDGQLRVRDVALGRGMHALSYLVPVLAGTKPDIDGTLSLDLYLEGQGVTPETLRKSIVGHGRVGLDPVALDGSRLLAGLDGFVDRPASGQVGDVWADLTVRNGRVSTDNLRVDVGKVPLVFAGWTDFDGRVSYRLRPAGTAESLPEKAQALLKELSPGLKIEELADLRVEGSVDSVSVTVNGVPLTPPAGALPGRAANDRRRLLDLGKRVRDRLLR